MRIIMMLLAVVFCLGTITTKGQELDSIQIIEKAKVYFKNVYVENTFKDPYSYELLKIISEPVTIKENARRELSWLDFSPPIEDRHLYYYRLDVAKKKDLAQKFLNKKGEVSKKNQEEYNQANKKYALAVKELELKEEELKKHKDNIVRLKSIIDNEDIGLNKLSHYNIEIHSYGANSYGNKVLGKYTFKINTKGEIISPPVEKLKGF